MKSCQSDSACILVTTLTIFNRSISSWPHWNFVIWSSIIMICIIVGKKLSSSWRFKQLPWWIQWHIWQNWQSLNSYNKTLIFMPRISSSFNLCYRFPPTSMRRQLGWQRSYWCVLLGIMRWCQGLTFELTWSIDIDRSHYLSSLSVDRSSV